MNIGGVDLERDVLVIAEIGNNHEGSIETAKALVRKAAECGVHGVKFQTFQAKYFVSPRDKARFDRLSRFELSIREFEELQRLAKSLGLFFLSTPLDMESAAFLEDLVDCYKIASGDNNFYPLIERVCKTGKPIIVSSGLSEMAQVRKTVGFIRERWQTFGVTQELAVLHCVSSYPVPPDQANLRAIGTLARELQCTVGYSDHTLGILACLLAVTLGARIIEKHFTLDKQYSDFRDHRLSADPGEMAQLVRQIADVAVLLGTGEKIPQRGEAEAERLIRRSIVTAADLPAGHRVRWEDLTWIRPGGGISPGDEARVVGKRLKRPFVFGEPIMPTDVE